MWDNCYFSTAKNIAEMKPKNRQILRGKAASTQAADARRLLSALLILTAAVWILREAGLMAIMHIRAIPVFITGGSLSGHTTPGIFMMATNIIMAVIWLWGVAMSRKMSLGWRPVIGMAVVIISSVLALGFDVELLRGFGLSPEVMMRYGLTRTYVFMLLDIIGLGLFIVPTPVGGGLKVLFAIYPLTGFMNDIGYTGLQTDGKGMEQMLTIFAIIAAVKVIYAAIIVILALRWRKAAH